MGADLIAALVALASAVAPAHAACSGDCDGNGAVGIEELVTAVGIALGTIAVGQCAAADGDGDGTVGIAELVLAVGRALDGCGDGATPTPVDALPIVGNCRQPGPRGLAPCDLDALIVAWRCNQLADCIAVVPSRTRLGDGPVRSGGNFAFTVDRTAAQDAAMLLEAPVGGTLYRGLDLGTGGGGRAAGQPAERTFALDPSSEATVRLLDAEGLEHFDAAGVRDLHAAVALANADTDFAGLDAEAAAARAEMVAAADPAVQQILAAYRPAPTATPTPPAPTPSATASSTPSLTLPPTVSATATCACTVTATLTPTRTASATISATPTRTGTPTRTDTATRTPTRTSTSTRTASATRTPTFTRTTTATRTPTATPTTGLAAQITTNRGCIETGQSPVFAVGEQATILFRADGASGGMTLSEAHLTLFDFINGAAVGSADLGNQPTGMTLGLQVTITPPTGTETLVLVAEAPGPLEAEAQCSFLVVAAAPGCTTACDCAPGQACMGGSCQMAGGPRYCCVGTTCPAGFDCQFPNGAFGTCGGAASVAD